MLKIQIETDNAAFEDEKSLECGRILREIADKMEEGYIHGPCLDYNGNKVGTWELRA